MNERLAPPNALELTAIASSAVGPTAALENGIDVAAAASLPDGHPLWQRDVLSISARVRAVVAALQPIAVRVLSFWDHVTRSARIGTRTIEIDPSGSYRLR